MLDKSFQALVFSLILHALLALFFVKGLKDPAPKWDSPRPIEVVYEERERKTFVPDAGATSTIEDLKKQARYLSRLTQRVKDEVVALRSGQTTNRTGQDPSESEEIRSHGVGGLGVRPQFNRPEGPQGKGPERGFEMGAGPMGRNVVIGQSTIGENIPGVKEGAFTALNTDRFTHYSFFSRVHEQVRNRWVPLVRSFTDSQSASELVLLSKYDRITQIEIILDPKGQYVRSYVLKSSGYNELDQAALYAFKAAAPFPNPPKEMMEKDGLLHLQYGFMVRFNPYRMVQ